MSPGRSRPTAKAGSFLRAFRHVVALWQAIFLLLFLTWVAFLVARSDDFGLSFDLIGLALLVIFIASQIFWIGRIIDFGERVLPSKPRRRRFSR